MSQSSYGNWDRDLFDKLEAEAKTCTREGVPAEEMCIVIVVDYFCQNLELPSFQMDQPKETKFVTPETVLAFSIVNCNSEDKILYAYIYSKVEGDKGRNAV